MKTPKKDNPSLRYARAVLRGTDQTSDKFVLRLPDGMRDMVAEMAERNGRSMNAEIVNALAHQIARFSPEKEVPARLTELMNDAMAERIRRGEIQHSVREMSARLEHIAKELDHIVSESREAVQEGENPPA